MPNRCFRMLICGPSGSGETNTLMDVIYNLLYCDKIFLYAKNLEKSKYQNLLNMFNPISNKDVGYHIIEASNDQIIPVSEFKKNKRPLIDYFIRGRHKNCSVIYLSQSYFFEESKQKKGQVFWKFNYSLLEDNRYVS